MKPRQIHKAVVDSVAPAATSGISLSVRSNLWHTWTAIALQHEAEVLRARAGWDESQSGEHLDAEYRASLVTIVSVTCALDALQPDIAKRLDRPVDDTGRKQWSYIRDTFAMACQPPRGWQPTFERLYSVLRPAAVHSRTEVHKPIWHEGLKTNIARENHLFCAETSSEAVNLLASVLDALFGGGTGLDSRLASWAHAHGGTHTTLLALRGLD